MANQRILYTEEMVGDNHPSKADTLNRHAMVEHNEDGTHAANIIGKNLLINGGMMHAQRGASGSATFDATTVPLNSDDEYLLDRWILLSDGNDIVDVTQQTLGGVSGQEAYVRLDVETTAKKFGFLQIIENKNCKSIIGSTASVSAEIKVTNATKLSDIRMVVLSWDNGIDTPTSDLVSTWNAEGAIITPIANWTAENVAANLAVTTSWVKYTIENISIDAAGADNVAVFIYQNNVATNDTAGIFLEITNVQLERNAVATGFEYRDVGHELSLCQRYYCKSYSQSDAPGTNTVNGLMDWSCTLLANADSEIGFRVSHPVTMRAVPTITTWDLAETSGKVTAGVTDNAAASVSSQGDAGATIGGIAGAASTIKRVVFHYAAAAEL